MKTRRQILASLLAVPALTLPVVAVFSEQEYNQLRWYGLLPEDFTSKEAAKRAVRHRMMYGPFPKNISAIGSTIRG